MFGKRTFDESLRLWIYLNSVFGYFPFYLNSNKRITKLKYSIIPVLLTFSFRVGLEFIFSKYFKARLNHIGLFFDSLDYSFIVMWGVLGAIYNGKLPNIFKLFDKYDDSFRKFSCTNLPFKRFYQFPINQFMFVISFIEFLFSCYLISKRILPLAAIGISGVRLLLRFEITSFIILNFHLMNSLIIRLDILKRSWHETIETKIHRQSLHSKLFNKINDFKLLYFELVHIVDCMNDCFGSRFVILYTQLFYHKLLYFFVVSTTRLPRTVPLVLIPTVPIITVVLFTKKLLNSACFTSVILRLPAERLPDRLLLQIYSFSQQLHLHPLRVNAAGFFNVDQNLLNSIYMAIASYSVAIFQLTPMMIRIGERTSYAIF